MPIFDYSCDDCGKQTEVLITGSKENTTCPSCGSSRVRKLMSKPSSFSGASNSGLPGSGDTSCCGSRPSHTGCSGPGSCCGKSF